MKQYLITGGTGMVGSHLVNEIKKTVKDGRSEYGDEPEQGLTVDTVVLFCPRYGVVIIPSNRGGISQSDFKSFF